MIAKINFNEIRELNYLPTAELLKEISKSPVGLVKDICVKKTVYFTTHAESFKYLLSSVSIKADNT